MKKHLMLISAMRKDSRQSLTYISKKTKIPISTLFDLLRKSGTFHRFTCLPDFQKIGYAIRATLLLSVAIESRDALQQHLLSHPHVNMLCKINNGYDYLVEVLYADIKEVEALVDRLRLQHGVTEARVHYVLDDLAREHFLRDEKQLLHHS